MKRDCDNNEIGLVGIGLVGTALAERFLEAGWQVVGYDVSAARCEHLRDLGGQVVDSPAEVAGRTESLLLSLPNSAVTRDVVHGPAGLLAAPQLPAYVLDTTTGDPDETVTLAEQLRERSVRYLDATISGSSGQVRQGEALFMVGGDEAAFAACGPLFDLLGKKTFYVGPSGCGSKSKLATNLVLGLNRLVLAEGMVFAEKLGLSLDTFLELLKAGPAYSAAVDVKGEKMLTNDFEPVSRIRQHHKDVALILKHAMKHHQHLPLSNVHFSILEKAIAAGDGDLDTSAVIKEIRR